MLANGILLVVGDGALRDGMRDLLSAQGYQVTEARDGAAGLRALGETPSELIIVDMGLPDMDGAEFVRQVARDGSPSRLVAMTPRRRHGIPDPLVVVRQFADVRALRTPFTPEQLMGVVEGAKPDR
jgi:DNA-binding response OmpR family regulator